MSEMTIRAAYGAWPEINRRLRDVVAGMTNEQLAFAHDVSHITELNETLGVVGLPQVTSGGSCR